MGEATQWLGYSSEASIILAPKSSDVGTLLDALVRTFGKRVIQICKTLAAKIKALHVVLTWNRGALAQQKYQLYRTDFALHRFGAKHRGIVVCLWLCMSSDVLFGGVFPQTTGGSGRCFTLLTYTGQASSGLIRGSELAHVFQRAQPPSANAFGRIH